MFTSKEVKGFNECESHDKVNSIPPKVAPILSIMALTPTLCFPIQFIGKKSTFYVDKIQRIFSQVKSNIPFLDAIQQIPIYARFLKELCTTQESH